MSPETRAAWEMFVANCNWSMPHPLDMKRFHEFIVLAHRADNEIDIEALLDGTHATDLVKEHLILQYESGRDLLKVNDALSKEQLL